jgi:hypothetical protein
MSLLSTLLERLGVAKGAIKKPPGFSSKKMASRLGGDEAIGEKFYTGQTRPRSDGPVSAPFEADIVPYSERVYNQIPTPESIPSNAKRNAMLAAGGAIAGTAGLGGYLAGSPSDDEIMQRYIKRKMSTQF